MAKTQTFSDKSKKKGSGSELISIKIVSMTKTDSGTYKFNERLVRVKDLAEADKLA
jgi:hypothetical protein